LKYWKKNNKFVISQTGNIAEWVMDGNPMLDQIPIYPFMFNAYSRFDPSMRHLDDKGEIFCSASTHDICKFNKTFESNVIENLISFSENGLTWDMNYDGVSQKFHFGLVFPGVEDICFENKPVDAGLINYQRFSKRSFPGQVNIKYPMLSFRIQGVRFISYTPFLYSSQFFNYTQNGQQCLRVSVATSDTFELTVCLFKSEEKKNKETYLKFYPYADMSLRTWKQKCGFLSKKYNIDIWYSKESCDKKNITNFGDWKWAKNEDIDNYFPILSNALSKYDDEFADKLDIEGIVLCSSLTTELDSKNYVDVKGIYTGKDIVLNVIPPIEEKYIHHEIYHSVSKNELECDTFADLMTNCEKVDLDLQGGYISPEFVKSVKEKITDKGVKLSWAIPNYERINVPEILKIVQSDDNTCIDDRTINIVGSQNSGLSLLAAILNCSADISINKTCLGKRVNVHYCEEADWISLVKSPFIQVQEASFLGSLAESNTPVSRVGGLKRYISKIIYITRHPLSFASSFPDAIDALRRWEKDQAIYYAYFNHYNSQAKFHLRYEDLLLSKKMLQKVFEFIGVEYSSQFLRYDDFAQYPDVQSSSKLFSKGEVDPENIETKNVIYSKYIKEWWDKRKKFGIIQALGYDKWSLGE